MKKIIIAILAIIYLGTSVGATIRLHYCMGKIAESSLWETNSKTCGNCGMEMSEEEDNGCCKDEHIFFKIDNDQKTIESYHFNPPLQVIDLPETVFSLLDFPTYSPTEKKPVSHAPLRRSGVAVYIRNCTFLI